MANRRRRAIPEPSADEREELERWVRRPKTTQALALRARIVPATAAGESDVAVAERLGTTRVTVGKWRRRFVASGCDGLLDEPRSGAPRRIGDADVERVVAMTLESMPRDATHWSTRSMAKAGGPGPATVGRIRRAFGPEPHRVKTFKLSRDPLFVGKVRDIVGLHPHPPERAVVPCVDGKSQIQALDRTQPIPPMRPGTPERRTHDCKRHGTTSLFAALNTATGEVLGACRRRHRAVGFRNFLRPVDRAVPADLEAHPVLDNYGTHKTAMIRQWLARHPRFHPHFTPTGASRLNLVERRFALPTEKQLRRGTHTSTAQPEKAITDHLEIYNRDPKPFRWTKSADDILNAVKSYCLTICEAGH